MQTEIADNDAAKQDLTITEKGAADAGVYTVTITVGDKSDSFTFEVTKKAQSGTLAAVSAGSGVTSLTLQGITKMDEITKDAITVTKVAKAGGESKIAVSNFAAGTITIDSTDFAAGDVIKVTIRLQIRLFRNLKENPSRMRGVFPFLQPKGDIAVGFS